MMTGRAKKQFQRTVYKMGETYYRDFPWRRTRNPFHILVSEVMLQQTQAGERTISKYKTFIKTFPTVHVLARARLKDVLLLWQGLGYNRRAKSLRETASIIFTNHNGKVPRSQQDLEALPGVGPYTAAAVCAFAFNNPAVLIETNIRSVFIHSFWGDKEGKVLDRDILPFVEETLDRSKPRVWYSALMDYGAMLKKCEKDLTRRSARYVPQSSFKGSARYIRGQIIKFLSQNQQGTGRALTKSAGGGVAVVKLQLSQLVKEQLLVRCGHYYRIAD